MYYTYMECTTIKSVDLNSEDGRKWLLSKVQCIECLAAISIASIHNFILKDCALQFTNQPNLQVTLKQAQLPTFLVINNRCLQILNSNLNPNPVT